MNRKLITSAFVLSGMAALIYEILWIRLFKISFGSTTLTLTLIFTSFLVGFSLGSFIFGRIKIKKNYMLLFVFEIMLAALGIFVTLTANQIYVQYAVIKYILLFLLVLIPATLFGGIWPLIHKIYVKSLDNMGKDSGVLFSFNTIGSGIGVLLAGFVLIPLTGLIGTAVFAALLNIVAGIIFFAYGRSYA